ncbi:BCNT-domain-containing protein, partial [Periconia macrospinosa]
DSDDDDFNPADAPADESASSSDEDEAPAKPVKGKGKRKRKAQIEDELDSGDEVTIHAARKAKKRKGAKGRCDDEDSDLLLSDLEDGEGGLIKTRAQRRDELKERKPLANIEGATMDIDALWAQMLAAPLKPLSYNEPQQYLGSEGQGAIPNAPGAQEDEEQITITKTYTFAGQDTTEEKQVPRSSLEQYLADGWKAAEQKAAADGDTAEAKDDAPKIRRPLRRPTRFDPNPTGFVRALPPEHQLSWPRKTVPATAAAGQENVPAPGAFKPVRPGKTQKLNVVDKSRMDWTGFVHKEGIAEELDTHGKTKEAYLGRMNFLADVEAKQEEERRRIKMATA